MSPFSSEFKDESPHAKTPQPFPVTGFIYTIDEL